MIISIRPIALNDYKSWCKLYSGYADFYEVKQTPEMRDKTWAWLIDSYVEVNGLVAIDENGILLGLAHYRPFSRPLSATIGGFLDDLYVDPSARENGIGSLLINAVAEIGRKQHWSVIRWITAEDNKTARLTYDKLALQTKWVTYDIKL